MPLLDAAAVAPHRPHPRLRAHATAASSPSRCSTWPAAYMVRTADLRRYLGLDATPPGLTA